jgi:hypothetical protein
VRCNHVGLVQVERVLTGSVLTLQYYCAKCEHKWDVLQEDRRTPALVTLRAKPDRRKA